MKRKLIGVLLVLAMTSWVGAAYFSLSPLQANYNPSDIITISLVDSGQVTAVEFDAITDKLPGGSGTYGTSVSGSVVYNPSWDKTYTTYLHYNMDGVLVENIGATETASGHYVTGTLFSFQYHVPSVPASTYLTITSYNDGGTTWYPAEVDYIGGGSQVAPPEFTATIHVVPEPTSMLLLGLGGLLLRRRK